MSDYFAFRFSDPCSGHRQSLVMFFASRVNMDVISKALKADVSKNLIPKNVYLISFQGAALTQEECLKDASFSREFYSYVGDAEESLRCLYVCRKSGALFYCDGDIIPGDLSKAILNSGMISLFRSHGGLIVSNHGYHFVKPSGDHCDKFIRASNLLVSSVEVSFLAISLLPHIRSDLKRIYVDTSSVSFLVSLAIQLFGDFNEAPPSIESFASYAVLNEQFDFVEDRSSLVVISATTSGSLAKGLLDKQSFSRDQVVTLFHINLPSNQVGVFDVGDEIGDALKSSKASNCDFCDRGSKLIRIAGDQFLPENPKHELLIIKRDHFGKRGQLFFRQFGAENVLLWNMAASQAEDSKEHFYIAVDRAVSLGVKPFSDVLRKNIRKHVSRDLATIIVFNGPGAEAINQEVRSYLGNGSDLITWLKPDELEEESLQGTASVLVIVGAITSGRSLLAISRKLRCIDPSATITYLVGFSKLPNDDAYKQLEKDLTLGGHDLVVLCHCSVPRIKEYTKTAWDSEKALLMPLGGDDPMGDLSEILPCQLSKRREQLLADSSDPQGLFLPDSNGQQLRLRRTFAFWSALEFDEARLSRVNQSDVYWTIQSVLHELRNASDNKGLATPYHTTLISPANFDRYNDGVIQACLLRSAHPVELDYRVDAVFSRQMTDVILSVIANWDNAQGEAALEFLMALWTERLCVNDEHLKEIVGCRDQGMPEDMIFIIDKLSGFISEEG